MCSLEAIGWSHVMGPLHAMRVGRRRPCARCRPEGRCRTWGRCSRPAGIRVVAGLWAVVGDEVVTGHGVVAGHRVAGDPGVDHAAACEPWPVAGHGVVGFCCDRGGVWRALAEAERVARLAEIQERTALRAELRTVCAQVEALARGQQELQQCMMMMCARMGPVQQQPPAEQLKPAPQQQMLEAAEEEEEYIESSHQCPTPSGRRTVGSVHDSLPPNFSRD